MNVTLKHHTNLVLCRFEERHHTMRYRQMFSRKKLMMIGMPSATAAFCFWAQGSHGRSRWKTPIESFHETPFNSKRWSTNLDRGHAESGASSAFACASGDHSKDCIRDDLSRSFQTSADRFYKENKKIPLPPVVHATLPQSSTATNNTLDAAKSKKNILVIGDVHGCYDELLELHAKAVKENDSMQFEYVILVGDLCNKGPQSTKVIRHARLNQGWFSVRGNHDDAALAAALGDPNRLKKETYQWVKSFDSNTERKTDSVMLCDDDVQWLSELPYTIQIPGDLLKEDEDTLIVHAGLIPFCDLQDQKIRTMTTIRDLISRCDEKGQFTRFEYHNGKGGEAPKVLTSKSAAKDDDSEIRCDESVAWASAWRGPQRVIFGHDARRKLQLHEGHWATGLDTGAVYGGELTGIILPERKLVSVQSKEYSPIKVKANSAKKIKEVDS